MIYNQNKYNLAKDLLEDIWNVPNNAEIVNLLGMCYLKLKDYKKAKIVFKKLEESYPHNHLVMANMAQSCLLLGELDEAKNYALKAIEIFPDFKDAIKILSKIKKIEEEKNE